MSTNGQDYLPDVSLQRVVDAIWVSTASELNSAVRIQPDGCSDVIWHMRGERVSVSFVGPMSVANIITPQLGDRYVGVRFKPGITLYHPVIPMWRFRDQIIPFRNTTALKIGKRLSGYADEVEGDVLQVEAWLQGLIENKRVQIDSQVEAVLNLLHGQPHLHLDSIYDLTQTSPRTIQRRFLELVGYTPKLYARIHRHRLTVQALLNQAPMCSTSQLAAKLGYSDQAHLVREFRHFAGVTPEAFRSEQ
jgi:AraC-like DNA-binding protein